MRFNLIGIRLSTSLIEDGKVVMGSLTIFYVT
jgi:hypothetical protein